MPLSRWWFLALVAIPGLGFASAARPAGGQTWLAKREHHVWSSASHDSEYAALVQTASRTSCGAMELPQALATPDPLLEAVDSKATVSVSFIIGTDGRVHSALILESAGPKEDRIVLGAVRLWRYRPARCNGIPTDAEAKVEFSSR
jgi:TonB family protein